ncbi:chemotaxis protein CheW [Bdellovibrio reynosensis]|uniref:histidine kinase n=1 Tax=Bdellovibrio reynosensis TaxID=2835041 RepID=A0ABY4C6U7_9BACT|nr:chemotaxis protein CheW [Bdellovibrio reynosensis]UOF00194.1 chemotaxis protein CheW [Bdellovibrio reynosensis]
MSDVKDDLELGLKEFWQECDDLGERISSNLALMEKGDFTNAVVDELYRDIHTLKGSAFLFGFNPIGNIAHVMETRLEPVRDDHGALSNDLIELLYKGIDVIAKMVELRREKTEKSQKDVETIVPQMVDSSIKSVGGELHPMKENAELNEMVEKSSASDLSAEDHHSALSIDPSLIESIEAEISQISTVVSEVKSNPVHEPVKNEAKPAPAVIAKPVATKAAAAPTASAAPAQGDDANSSDPSSSIRVPVSLLDRLMTLMGEMVLVRNQVLQYSSKEDNLEFLNLSQRLDVVTTEVQNEMMKTRMQPIGNILNKFQRLVRDLSRDLNKKMELHLQGTETELDKTLLEAVKDPLTHIIRNSCDHGMETPEERRQAGKAETGHITVRAFHEGGQVVIEISDDGRGLHKDKILNKALEKGLITPDKAAALSEREVHNLIFAPGFSTAAQVTNISGRGVGMDVVRSNIDKIGGVVELHSTQGAGTTIRLKIPLTLAIVPAMIVRCDDDRYAIPQVKLVELVRVDNSNSESHIEYLQGNAFYRLRGNLLPLVNMKSLLGFCSKNEVAKSLPDVINIVVVRAERQLFGLIVDEVVDTADIVVKPLARFLKSVNVYSGATVLGDGSIALILDVMGIAQRLSLMSSQHEALNQNSISAGTRGVETQEFLLFRLNSQARHAIPLDLVHRLEEFKTSDVQKSGDTRVIHYRGSILPLISLNSFLGYHAEPSKSEGEILPVIVTRKNGQYFGIEVTEILDVLQTEANVESAFSDKKGILGNVLIEKEIIVIVDSLQIIDELIPQARSHDARTPEVVVDAIQRRRHNILYAEDNAFFRKHVKTHLEKAGYTVITAIDGSDAILKLEEMPRHEVSLIISDIEMPKMNGLQLAGKIRKDESWKDIVLLALTTKYDDRSLKEGLEAGFNAYLEKLNPDSLIQAIDKHIFKKAG